MSEPRSKAPRRPRKPQTNENDSEVTTAPKGVVILAKNAGRKVEEPSPAPQTRSEDKEASSSPQVLRSVKVQQNRETSKNHLNHSSSRDAISRANGAGGDDAKLARGPLVPPVMSQRAKFMNKYFELEEDLLQYLTDDSSFKVIGVIGLQGVGKSHVMNIIAGKTIFPVEKAEDIEQCRHRTVGIDAYVCPERTILLDVQPVLALSIMDILIQNEKRTPSGAIDYHQSLESQVMVESLQTASLLLSICHTVIVAIDWFFDRDLAQFIQSAEMLKPTIPKNATTNVLDEEITDYFPHMVFVKNKCDFVSVQDSEHMVKQLNRVFKDSMLIFKDGITNSFGEKSQDDTVNLFQIPDKSDENYELICQEFVSKLVSMPQDEFAEGAANGFSEKNWFQYSSNIWDGICKSSMFMEYKRLLV